MPGSDIIGPAGPLILFYNGIFGVYPDLDRLHCGVPCRFTIDRRRLAEADAVIFHMPDIRDCRDARKYPGQLWIAFTMESRAHTSALSNHRLMRHFDILMSPERSADVWAPYVPEARRWQTALAMPLQEKTERRPAVMFQSATDDKSGRNAFAAELMRFMKVDSYGKFMNNRVLPEPDQGPPSKLSTIARYRFCLSFENTIEEDYVTEKFYQPLLAGTVPVYLGAPNAADFAPGKRCYIDAGRFGGPRGLAAYLLDLANDEQAYSAYFEWRSEPFRPAFIADLAMVEKERITRLAEFLCERIQPRGNRSTGETRPSTPFGWRAFARTRWRRAIGASRA